MTTTLNAPPDQINGGLTLGDGTTLNVGEGGTVSGIAVEPGAVVNVNGGAASNITVNGTFNHGGTINVNGGTVSGTTVNGTLNLNDGKITGTTLNELGTLNLNDGTAVNTLIIDTGVMNVSGGIIDGISFDLSPNQSSYELQLNDFSSLQGPLGFDAPGLRSGPVGHYKVSLDFKHDDPSASVTLTRQTQTITIDYGQNQSVTYHYTTNKFTSVSAVALLHEHHQIELIVDVLVAAGPAPAFSAQSAATLVYTAEFGSAPDATELNVLNQFTQAQFAYGQQIGVQDPKVYAFEALGVALASSGQQFQSKFGPSNSTYPASATGDAQFGTDAYTNVFGHAGSAAQVQHFVDQLNFFETLYTAAGTFGSASNIDLLARGAIYGQMLGIEHEGELGSSQPAPVLLTTGQDSVVLDQSGSTINGTFGGAGATWTLADFIASADTTNETFNIQGIGAAGVINVTSVPGAHVVGVQNVHIAAASGQAVQGDFTTTGPEGEWLGLTQLTVESTGSSEGVDNLTVGPDTAVQVTDTVTTETNEALTVDGGSTITIVENNMARNHGITVNGGSGTTSVSITQTDTGEEGNFDGDVKIVDVNGASATEAGTITNVTLDGLGGSANRIIDNALTDLTINYNPGAATLVIENNLTTPAAATLTLNISHDALAPRENVPELNIADPNNEYSTVHLSLGAQDSFVQFQGVNGLTTLDTPNAGTGALVGDAFDPINIRSAFVDAVAAAVNFDFSGLNGPNDIAVFRGGSFADVYTLGNFGTDNGFFGTKNIGLVQMLEIGNDAADNRDTINFGSGAYIIDDAAHSAASHNYVETAANGTGLANLNTAPQWAIINNTHGGANSDTLTFKTDNVQTFINLGGLDNVPASDVSAIAGGIGKALNTLAHTVVAFTFNGNTFIFDHADDSFALTPADAMVELTGIHPIAAINGAHEITFAT